MNWKILIAAVASIALVLMPTLAMADGSKVEKGGITRTGTGSALNLAEQHADEEDEGIAAGAIVAGAGGALLLGGLAAFALGGGGGGIGPTITGPTITGPTLTGPTVTGPVATQ